MENDEENPSITIDNLKEAIAKYKTKLANANKILEGKQTTLNFFKTVVSRLRKTVTKDTKEKRSKVNLNNLQEGVNLMDLIEMEVNLSDNENDDENDDETCGICLGEIPEEDVGVTTCGHIYCYECLKIWTTKNHRCPYCQRSLSNNDVLVLSYQKPKNENEEENEEEKSFEQLINEVGTKSAHVVKFLKETSKHTIVFSQWDDLLRRFGHTLDKNGIKHVFCKGNCYQRDKAIRTFNQSEDIKVIMLSSDSAAAGTNLTKASQVIFLDPIYGNYEFRREQERQAVGRAHRLGQENEIEVIRFIIKDSVEEEIYMKNKEENEAHKISSTVQDSESSDTMTETDTEETLENI